MTIIIHYKDSTGATREDWPFIAEYENDGKPIPSVGDAVVYHREGSQVTMNCMVLYRTFSFCEKGCYRVDIVVVDAPSGEMRERLAMEEVSNEPR